MKSHVRPTPLTDRLYDYVLSVGVREPDVLRRLRAETAKLRDGEMQTAPEQGPVLDLLIRLTGASRVLEVGTFTGYGTLWMALALPEGGRVVTCDVSVEYTNIAKPYWKEAGVFNKIGLMLAPALETLDKLLAGGQAGGYDLAYIDADKANVVAYYERCLELVRGGGMIAIDNTLWDGKPADPNVTDDSTTAIRALNAKIFTDERADLCFLPFADGMTLCRKRA
jgi:predicted O-methyltransferase YrrM